MEHSHDRSEYTVSQRSMELVVAGAFMAVAVLVMWDNWRIGAGWSADGPESGYFPFYMGVIMFVASLGTFVTNLVTRRPDLKSFVERSQLLLVLKVLVPTIVFVVLINFLGIYLASAIFIAFFMTWLGKYPVYKVVPIAIGVPVVLFMMFEVWFLVPLPKGPLEAALGY
jgi:putative tricarboxylic transport membrane protein